MKHTHTLFIILLFSLLPWVLQSCNNNREASNTPVDVEAPLPADIDSVNIFKKDTLAPPIMDSSQEDTMDTTALILKERFMADTASYTIAEKVKMEMKKADDYIKTKQKR